MQITQTTLAYFSPTGTTQRVLRALAEGVQAPINDIDLTLPAAATQQRTVAPEALALFGAPVYAGRIAATAAARLRQIRGQGGPAVVVVVYGNRAYDDALLELRDLVADLGFVPVAAGAFIGEHSYHTDAQPIAPDRPDATDLALARSFGADLRRKLAHRQTLAPVTVPGNSPYRPRGGPSEIAPVTDAALCTLCGRCAEVCPVGAVTVGDTVVTDAWACTHCCACTRACPTGARQMTHPRIAQTRQWLSEQFQAPQQPEIYL